MFSANRRRGGVFGLRGVACAVAVAGAAGLMGAREAAAQFTVIQVAGSVTGNELVRPVFLTHAPGDYSRVFILEKAGRIRVLDITTQPSPTLQPVGTPFLNITGPVTGGESNNDERGLLGMAFHPQYQTNGKLYLYYSCTVSGSLTSRVSEFTNRNPTTLAATPGSNTLDPTSERIMMQFIKPQSNHNGGWMGFGPDGYLYIATGDGGGANDNEAGHNAAVGNGQFLGTLLGKILRIDVNGTGVMPDGGVSGPAGGYTVPSTNPFVLSAGTKDEVWAYGLRNPWRPSFDRQTGDLWIADVGQNIWEEINFQPALTPTNLSVVGGRNYGWRCFEGTVSFNTNSGTCPANADAGGLTGPLGVYAHSAGQSAPRKMLNSAGGEITGISITGGYVYRGCAVPELAGKYLFTDYGFGRVYSTTPNGTGGLTAPVEMTSLWTGSTAVTPSIPAITRPTGSLVSFGEDAYGEVYLVSSPSVDSDPGVPGNDELTPNGRIFKIVTTRAGHVPLSNADASRDGVVSIDDIFVFLNFWFAGQSQANFDRQGGVTIDDIFVYLNAWFRGSCPF